MAIPQKIIKYPRVAKGGDERMFIDLLEAAKIKYEPIKHRIVYTAFDKAATLKVPQKMIGKTLVVKLDKPTLVLIPANKNLDKEKLKKVAKVKNVDFLKETWMKKNLKGVKVGAIPPFGNLWPLARRGQRPGGGLATFTDRSLINQPKIIVNGGDYNWSIKISPTNFKKLIPDLIIGSFSKSRSR